MKPKSPVPAQVHPPAHPRVRRVKPRAALPGVPLTSRSQVFHDKQVAPNPEEAGAMARTTLEERSATGGSVPALDRAEVGSSLEPKLFLDACFANSHGCKSPARGHKFSVESVTSATNGTSDITVIESVTSATIGTSDMTVTSLQAAVQAKHD